MASLSPGQGNRDVVSGSAAAVSDGVGRSVESAEGPERGREEEEKKKTLLRTEYRATTNRMLRVAVNGFMESLGVVLAVMEELDVDVLESGLRSE